MVMDNFLGKGRPIVKYRDTVGLSVQKRLNQSMCHLDCARMGSKYHVLDGVQIPHGKGQFWGKGRPL